MNTQSAAPSTTSGTCRINGKVSVDMESPRIMSMCVLVGVQTDPVHGANIVSRQRDNGVVPASPGPFFFPSPIGEGAERGRNPSPVSRRLRSARSTLSLREREKARSPVARPPEFSSPRRTLATRQSQHDTERRSAARADAGSAAAAVCGLDAAACRQSADATRSEPIGRTSAPLPKPTRDAGQPKAAMRRVQSSFARACNATFASARR